jgi:hypothetical protein
MQSPFRRAGVPHFAASAGKAKQESGSIFLGNKPC